MMVGLFKPDEIAPVQGKSNEWFTPAKYVEAAREVMGSIDLDPASCFEANQTIRAGQFYSIEDDGLSKEWVGNIWLNPPYGKDHSVCNEKRSTIRIWIDKLLMSFTSGTISQAIVLVTSQTTAPWFHLLLDYPICFSDHNVRFRISEPTSYRPGRMTQSHIFGCTFAYLGPYVQKFAEVFSQFGAIVKRVSVPKSPLIPASLWDGKDKHNG